MKGYAYTGEKVPWGVPVSVYEGWLDAVIYVEDDNLYRYPVWKQIGWMIGHFIGLYLTMTKE
jgi:hypothetical protein